MAAERANTTPISELRNLGVRSAKMLASIGIHDRSDLDRVGPVLAYRAVREIHGGVSLNLLYAMYGALNDIRWNELSVESKARLRRDADEAAGIPPERPERIGG